MTEVGIVGAGVVGLAAADALVDRGVDVRLFDVAAPGSVGSAGLTRIFRHVHEEPSLVPLVRRAREAWRTWEERLGRGLIGGEGLVVLTDEHEPLAANLAAADVPYELLEEPRDVFPALAEGAGRALYDPGAGGIRVRRTIEALVARVGARVVRTEVLGVRADGDGALVQATEGIWRCDRLLVCAGGRTAQLAVGLGIDVPLVLGAHLRPTFPGPLRGDGRGMPCLIDRRGAFGEQVYASPVGSSGGYAIGLIGGGDVPVPAQRATVAGDVTPALPRLQEYVRRALPGMGTEPLSLRLCFDVSLPFHGDAFAAWQAGAATVLTGANMFKFAPLLGLLLADAAMSGEVPEELRLPTASRAERPLSSR